MIEEQQEQLIIEARTLITETRSVLQGAERHIEMMKWLTIIVLVLAGWFLWKELKK